MQGGANGAAPGGCSGGGKTWLFGTCTKSCSQRTSCVECLASDVCHYCEGTDSCVDAGSGSACLADQMKCPGFDTGGALSYALLSIVLQKLIGCCRCLWSRCQLGSQRSWRRCSLLVKPSVPFVM